MQVALSFVAPQREDGSLCPHATPISRGADVLHECRRQGMVFEDAWELAVEMVMQCAREADGELVDDSDLVAFTAYRPTYRASYLRLPQPKPAYDPKVRYDMHVGYLGKVDTCVR